MMNEEVTFGNKIKHNLSREEEIQPSTFRHRATSHQKSYDPPKDKRGSSSVIPQHCDQKAAAKVTNF